METEASCSLLENDDNENVIPKRRIGQNGKTAEQRCKTAKRHKGKTAKRKTADTGGTTILGPRTVLKLFTLLDVCVSSLLRGHAKIICIIPSSTDDPRRES